MGEPLADVQEFLKALASDTRQRILFLFVDNHERTVNEIAEAVGLGQSTASEHLSHLKRAGLLSSRRVGKEVYYKADRDRILALLRMFTDMITQCCKPD